jgi:ABC-type Zn2+ transport system substrate-binding protein/surface adhesin
MRCITGRGTTVKLTGFPVFGLMVIRLAVHHYCHRHSHNRSHNRNRSHSHNLSRNRNRSHSHSHSHNLSRNRNRNRNHKRAMGSASLMPLTASILTSGTTDHETLLAIESTKLFATGLLLMFYTN